MLSDTVVWKRLKQQEDILQGHKDSYDYCMRCLNNEEGD